MDQTNLNLQFESPVKYALWSAIEREIDDRLNNLLVHSQFLHLTEPSEETREQLAMFESICREIKQQLAGFETRSAYRADLRGTTRIDALRKLLKEEAQALL